MSNEEIVKEIDEATRLMAEAKVKMNGTLNLARGAIVKGNAVDKEAYNKGLNDAWELANKISDIDSTSERARIFNYVVGGITVVDILRDFTPQEALAKLEAYEKEQKKARQKIMVGDIVALEDGIKGVVMDEDGVDNVVIFTENGCIEAWMNKKYITKTSKHIDIQSLLEQIKE